MFVVIVITFIADNSRRSKFKPFICVLLYGYQYFLKRYMKNSMFLTVGKQKFTHESTPERNCPYAALDLSITFQTHTISYIHSS